jgi:outer membrane protein assembly factor BamB
MNRLFHVATIAAVVSLAAFSARGQDWPQWRGPAQNGVALSSPELVDSWGASGPKVAWLSEKLPGAENGGFSSLSIAGGRGYLFVNWKTHEPITVRKLSEAALTRLGWTKLKLPDDLAKAMEEARTSEDRAKLKGAELRAWVDKWVADRIPKDPNIKYAQYVTERLNRGPAAISLATLETLAAIKDKDFADQAAFDKWLQDANLAEAEKKAVLREVPTTEPRAKDAIVCLNLEDGKVVWKKEYPGKPSDYGSSSTPCVSGGRVYVAGTQTVYCFEAADGNEVWKVPVKAGDLSSSPVLVDGVLAILAGELVGLEPRDGNRLWAQPKAKGANASPVVWRKDGKAYLLCNTGGATVACVEAATGRLQWEVPGGGSGTVALGEDAFVIFAERKEAGLAAYRLSAEKPEKLWSQPWTDRGTTPVIEGNCVYAVGSNKAACLGLADGYVAWEQKYTCEIASPIVAGGRVFALVESGGTLLMVKAAADKFDLLSKFKLKAASCSSPSFSQGRLYVRLVDCVACYDLRK